MKTLRIPDEPRFVRAFALAVDPGDTLGLLMETGALGSPDVGIVRHTREALIPAYDRASDQKDWEQAHTIWVLRDALAQSDSAAYLAYHVRDNHRAAHTATEYAEALAIIGCAADSLSLRRRPWEIERQRPVPARVAGAGLEAAVRHAGQRPAQALCQAGDGGQTLHLQRN